VIYTKSTHKDFYGESSVNVEYDPNTMKLTKFNWDVAVGKTAHLEINGYDSGLKTGTGSEDIIVDIFLINEDWKPIVINQEGEEVEVDYSRVVLKEPQSFKLNIN